MALQYSPDSEDYYSLSGNEPEDADDDAESEVTEPPVHPVSAMQGAFEESIVESTQEEGLSRGAHEQDPEVRRQKLLNSNQYDHSLNSRWHQRATAQHHPLVKLLAQIIFGMHLLQQEQAKSEMEVVKILQTHVNEVDSFLERTAEDFDLAIKDIEERIRFLKLPMKHLEVFNTMLDDKKFRTQLLEGNEKIEKIIERTSGAMGGALTDVQTGIDGNRQLSAYLDSVHDQWPREKRAISDVFGAMRGNEQGWTGYLRDLQVKGQTLGALLERLGQVIASMTKMAAAASRRNIKPANRAHASASGSKSAPNSPGLRSKFAPDQTPPPMPFSPPSRSASLNKPLPREPPIVSGATHVGNGNGVHPVPLAQRFESPRQTPRFPEPGAPRPKTSDGPVRRKEARAADSRTNTAELLQFFKQEHSSPLRSNPPAAQHSQASAGSERKPVRSASEGANPILETRVPDRRPAGPGRPASQGTLDGLSNYRSIPTALPAISENDRPQEPQSPPTRSAFARRLSKRMRHMQQPEKTSQPQAQTKLAPSEKPSVPSSSSEKTASPPIDSAYASSVEKAPPAYEPARSTPTAEKHTLKGFTLFPRSSRPVPPANDVPATKRDEWAEDHKSVATSMSKGRSFGSMRKYFHMRKSSKMWSE